MRFPPGFIVGNGLCAVPLLHFFLAFLGMTHRSFPTLYILRQFFFGYVRIDLPIHHKQ